MLPGARTMPDAMVLPIAAAIPNHRPSTRKSRPRPAGRFVATLADGSKEVENEVQRGFRGIAIIPVRRENARPKAQPHDPRRDFRRPRFLARGGMVETERAPS